MQEETFDIQALVKASGIPRRTIHFYVQQGLLPPPEGAGLAAYYTGRHLVRLRLIPIFRQQGLRLDQMRHQFEQMTPEEMQQAVSVMPPSTDTKPDSAVKNSSKALADEPDLSVDLHRAWDAGFLAERRFIHYQLPGGISLVAPADLSLAEQQRLKRLLQAAAQIYERSAFPPVMGNNGQS